MDGKRDVIQGSERKPGAGRTSNITQVLRQHSAHILRFWRNTERSVREPMSNVKRVCLCVLYYCRCVCVRTPWEFRERLYPESGMVVNFLPIFPDSVFSSQQDKVRSVPDAAGRSRYGGKLGASHVTCARQQDRTGGVHARESF